MYWFTADLHLDHTNIMKHCNRPFKYVEEMNEKLIENWNRVVKKGDVVVVAGDFTLHHDANYVHEKFTSKLNGNKIFLKGNHDYWLKEKRYLYHKKIENQFVAVCHYPFRTWKNSQHGAWNLHGHSHGELSPFKNQIDVGVDRWNYYPVSFENIKEILS